MQKLSEFLKDVATLIVAFYGTHIAPLTTNQIGVVIIAAIVAAWYLRTKLRQKGVQRKMNSMAAAKAEEATKKARLLKKSLEELIDHLGDEGLDPQNQKGLAEIGVSMDTLKLAVDHFNLYYEEDSEEN